MIVTSYNGLFLQKKEDVNRFNPDDGNKKRISYHKGITYQSNEYSAENI